MREDFWPLDVEGFNPSRPDLPLLLLDIDGVLNAYGYRPAETFFPPDAFQDLTEYKVPHRRGEPYTFWVSDSVLEGIKEIHNSGAAEIAWLTTWEYQANDCVSPTLGLPDFPVAATQGGRFSDSTWKSRAGVKAAYLNRPVVWIDDMEINMTERYFYEDSGIPHLLIAPDPEFGLTRSDMFAIRAFLDAH